jgi:hypothetical protein
VIVGRALPSVIVPLTLKVIVSRLVPGSAFAEMIAARSDPAPLSVNVVTGYVFAAAAAGYASAHTPIAARSHARPKAGVRLGRGLIQTGIC